MLTEKDYVPVLRWKQAEWLALRHLGEDVRERITPLLEIPPSCFAPRKNDTTVDIHGRLDGAVRQIARSWGNRPFFLELSLLEGMGDAANSQLMVDADELCRAWSLRMIPVTGLSRERAYQDAVGECAGRSGQLCLRIGCAEARSAAIDRGIGDLVRSLGLEPKDVYLVVDFGCVDGPSREYMALAACLPHRDAWGSVIFCGGSFPVDLRGFPVGIRQTGRHEWRAWRDLAAVDVPHLGRLPTYADYTIQHAVYSAPPERPNPSASIRYTCEDSWLIFRGEGLRTSELGSEQYVGQAILLQDHECYYGEGYSYGDAYIKRVAAGQENAGSPMTWIRAGVNHHISVVVRQIAGLLG